MGGGRWRRNAERNAEAYLARSVFYPAALHRPLASASHVKTSFNFPSNSSSTPMALLFTTRLITERDRDWELRTFLVVRSPHRICYRGFAAHAPCHAPRRAEAWRLARAFDPFPLLFRIRIRRAGPGIFLRHFLAKAHGTGKRFRLPCCGPPCYRGTRAMPRRGVARAFAQRLLLFSQKQTSAVGSLLICRCNVSRRPSPPPPPPRHTSA